MQKSVAPQSISPSTDSESTSSYGWYVIVVMMFCQMLSYMDNSLPYILVEAIKADLDLTDTQIGLITGPAFSLTYAICALPIAKISDRYFRTRVISTAIVVWSGLTVAGGFMHSFSTFILCRAGVAIGESALAPAATSIITDKTSAKTRPIAMAVYSLGSPLGVALAMVLGGLINDRYGWRAAFLLIGGAGVILSLLVALTVREPVRRANPVSQDLPTGDLRKLLANAAIRNMLLGGALAGLSLGALTSWGPAYAMRTFHLSASQTGASFGPMVGLMSVVGMLIGGFAASRFATRRPGNAFRLLTVVLVIATATQLASLMASSYSMFLILTALSAFFVAFFSAPLLSGIQSLVDANARSFATAVLILFMSGVGMASGAFLTGFLSDQLRPYFGADSLRNTLIILTFGRLWAAAHFHLTARAMDRASHGH